MDPYQHYMSQVESDAVDALCYIRRGISIEFQRQELARAMLLMRDMRRKLLKDMQKAWDNEKLSRF